MSTDGDTPQTIQLSDNTIPSKTARAVDRTKDNAESGSSTPSRLDKLPSIHRPRADTIRKELARRKYARYQEGRYEEEEEAEAEAEAESGPSNPESIKDGRQGGIGGKIRREAARAGTLRHKLHLGSKKQRKKAKENEYVVDILYENQRGWFFCGVPLYSSRSLLNFDPAAWQTGELHDSPVNITNAQVPDPTWVWAWPAWYVDMSRDVDEEGWEYSFGFREGFAWHGAAPWFSSFVRRRRWLRKRIRAAHSHWKHDALHEAHHLNPDYFTIHASADAAADSSRDTSQERGGTPSRGTSTFLSRDTRLEESDSGSEDELERITDVNSLLRHLKRTTIDRKKLDAFQHFLAEGGAELHYLADAMPEVIALFLYQHSRRQVVVLLQSSLREVEKSTSASRSGVEATAASPSAETPSEPPSLTIPSGTQRVSDLQSALDRIAASVHAMDYSTPLASPRSPRSPHRLSHRPLGINTSVPNTTDTPADEDNSDNADDDDDGFPAPRTTGSRDLPLPSSPTRDHSGQAIKGIPASAHVGGDVGLAARMDLAGREEIEKAAAAAVQAAARTRLGEDEEDEAGDDERGGNGDSNGAVDDPEAKARGELEEDDTVESEGEPWNRTDKGKGKEKERESDGGG